MMKSKNEDDLSVDYSGSGFAKSDEIEVEKINIHEEAEQVLSAVSNKIQAESKMATTSDEVEALASLVDSFTHLFYEMKR